MVPIRRFDYVNRSGLSERVLKDRMQKRGWESFRGGMIGVRMEYPNVLAKYARLEGLITDKLGVDVLDELKLINAVHHGMPDYLFFRRGELLFVECKLGHEQLSERQKKCIRRLQDLGFKVEVHKLVEDCTKVRDVQVIGGVKTVVARQERLIV